MIKIRHVISYELAASLVPGNVRTTISDDYFHEMLLINGCLNQDLVIFDVRHYNRPNHKNLIFYADIGFTGGFVEVSKREMNYYLTYHHLFNECEVTAPWPQQITDPPTTKRKKNLYLGRVPVRALDL